MLELSKMANGFEDLNEIIEPAFKTATPISASLLKEINTDILNYIFLTEIENDILNEGYGLSNYGKTPLSSQEISEIYKSTLSLK